MMVYKWPSSLLKKIETDMHNYLWMGDITKKGENNVNWTRCCAPVDEGRFGVRSLCLANVAFICKLTWDIMAMEGPSTYLKDCYFTTEGNLKNIRRALFIWPGIHRHAHRLRNGAL